MRSGVQKVNQKENPEINNNIQRGLSQTINKRMIQCIRNIWIID